MIHHEGTKGTKFGEFFPEPFVLFVSFVVIISDASCRNCNKEGTKNGIT